MKNIKKFIAEIHYAMDNVPFYGKLLSDLAITRNDITESSYFNILPFTQKRDYRKNFPKGVLAEGFTLNHPMLNKSQSSGTTGERLITFEIGMNLLQRANSCLATFTPAQSIFLQASRKICRYAAPNCSDVECANPNSMMEDRLLPDGTLVLPVYHDLMTTSQTLIDRAIEEVLSYQPDLFYVDPTHFAFLLREFKKRGLTPPKVPVITSYSAVTAVSRRQIEEFYPTGSHFTELLSSSEMGWVGMQCAHGKFHLNDDSFFFELVNSQNQLAKVGERAEICITSLDNGAVPHLRYRTGDMVRVEAPCSCGSDRQVVTLEGRETHFIVQENGELLSPKQVDKTIGAPIWLDLYQVEQVSEHDFVFKLVVNDHYQVGDEDPIIAQFKALFTNTINVRSQVVDYIPSERSGKFQAVKGMNQC